MTRFQFWFWPFLIAGLGSTALLCYAFGFNPFSWCWRHAMDFARAVGGR